MGLAERNSWPTIHKSPCICFMVKWFGTLVNEFVPIKSMKISFWRELIDNFFQNTVFEALWDIVKQVRFLQTENPAHSLSFCYIAFSFL